MARKDPEEGVRRRQNFTHNNSSPEDVCAKTSPERVGGRGEEASVPRSWATPDYGYWSGFGGSLVGLMRTPHRFLPKPATVETTAGWGGDPRRAQLPRREGQLQRSEEPCHPAVSNDNPQPRPLKDILKGLWRLQFREECEVARKWEVIRQASPIAGFGEFPTPHL